MTAEPGTLCVAIPSDDLCLAYVNTRYWRGTPAPTETLRGIAEITGWLADSVPTAALLAERCAAHWSARPEEGDLANAAAIGLREMLHRVLAAAAAGTEPDLSSLNVALGQAAPRHRLVCDGDLHGWQMDDQPPSAARLLSGVLWSAADMLAGPRRTRLRACANPKCGWLFLDDSKSGNRRWCAMSACGNRAKAHRHYLKAKAARGAA